MLLKELIEKRISLEKLETDLENLIEPSLLNILVEETVDTVDENFIKEILGYSLFMIQSEKEGYDINPLVGSMLSISRKFYSEVKDSELRKAIIKREKKRNNVEYDLNKICITSGVTESLQILLNALLNSNDENNLGDWFYYVRSWHDLLHFYRKEYYEKKDN